MIPFSATEIEAAALRPLWPSSYGRPHHHLTESIKSLGLIRPLIAAADGSSYRLAAGSLRLKALKELGWAKVPAIVLPPDFPWLEMMEIALADNGPRGWNQAETALIWRYLNDNFSQPEAIKLSAWLELDRSPKIRAWAYQAAQLLPKGLELLASGALDLESAARLAAWAEPGQGALLDIFETLAPSKQKKRQWLDWLEDIARREGLAPVEILKAEPICEALGQAGRTGKPTAENAARQYLWARRHPLLAQLTQRRRAQITALKLPKNMKLTADPTFEDLEFSLNLTFATPDELKTLAVKLRELAENPAMAAMMNEGGQ